MILNMKLLANKTPHPYSVAQDITLIPNGIHQPIFQQARKDAPYAALICLPYQTLTMFTDSQDAGWVYVKAGRVEGWVYLEDFKDERGL